MFNDPNLTISMRISMKYFHYLLMLILTSSSLNVSGQFNRFKEGYIIDKSGTKYSGTIKLTEGVNGEPDYLIFKESDKSDKIKLTKESIRSFVMEKDSFVVVNNYKIPSNKKILSGFAKVLLNTPNGSICELLKHDRLVTPSGSAGNSDKDYYFIIREKNFTLLTNSNFKKEISVVVENNSELKKKINSGELRLAHLYQIIDLYNSKQP